MNPIETLLFGWLDARVDEGARASFRERLTELERAEIAARPRVLETIFARVPRLLGIAPLAPDESELAAAAILRPGWSPTLWTVADVGRTLLLLALERELEAGVFAQTLRRLRQSGDPAEQVALFRSLPLLKPVHALGAEAAEGLRSNIPDVLAALTHGNPFPSETFDEPTWNQMILKALFTGVALAPIPGLDARANCALAIMLRNFARERRAAGRPTPRDLWRCLAPFAAEAEATADLASALRESAAG